MPVTRRLARKIEQVFPADSAAVISILNDLKVESSDGDAGERILAGVILVSRGDVDRLFMALEILEEDWRDLLMEAGLASEAWQAKLDAFLGPGER